MQRKQRWKGDVTIAKCVYSVDIKTLMLVTFIFCHFS